MLMFRCLLKIIVLISLLFFGELDIYAQFDIVKSYQKINKENGNFAGALDKDDNFGSSLANLDQQRKWKLFW